MAEDVCLRCGELATLNPHPDAGNDNRVGDRFECIPCLVGTVYVLAGRIETLKAAAQTARRHIGAALALCDRTERATANISTAGQATVPTRFVRAALRGDVL